MPEVEVDLPEEVWSDVQRLVETEFMNQQEAVETLLSEGLQTYSQTKEETERAEDMAEEYADDMWDTADGGMAEEEEFGEGPTF